MGKVEVSGGAIRIDGKPVQMISGTIHYFRVHPELWRDRIEKAKMMGLNAIETYLCHNLHEPHKGEFDFSDMLDFERFLDEIHRAGLYAIVRPGPYICAEWENGGLPPWLSVEPGIDFRCSNPAFLEANDRYLNKVLPMVKKHLYTAGGPVVMMQIENEYGSYGKDRNYLEHIRQVYLRNGIDVPLFTSDGPCDWMLHGGTIPECYQTLNFGSRSEEAFRKGREYRPEGPDFCMEFWNGWFDHWGEKHHTRPAKDAAKELDAMLKAGASVNFYVFHGGTNFGFMAGANGNGAEAGDYGPTVTSYDYDAPLSESGDPTPKFFAFQEVIRKYRKDAAFGTPRPGRKQSPGRVKFIESAPLFGQLDRLSARRHALKPLTMEACGQSYGFINYRTVIDGPAEENLYFPEVRDRVSAYLDGEYLGTVYRNDANRRIPFRLKKETAVLDLLVENTGRVNYGPLVGRDLKGLPLGVCIGWQSQIEFDIWNLELDDISKVEYGEYRNAKEVPAFHRGYFEAEAGADTFVRIPGVKGVVWINGFNLGRYWNIGPCKTLYVPAPVLKEGRNQIVVLELHQLDVNSVKLTDKPKL